MGSQLACTILFLTVLPIIATVRTANPSSPGRASGQLSDGVSARTSPAHARQEVDANELKDVLRDFIRASRQSFQELRAGSGRRVEETILYPSSLPIPAASETLIWIPIGDRRAYVRAKLYAGNDQQHAQRVYIDFVAKLKVAFRSSGSEDGQSNDTASAERRHIFEPNFDGIGAVVEVSSSCRSTSGGCIVTLTVRAPEGAQKPKTVEEVAPELPKKRIDIKTAALEVINKLVATEYEAVRADFNDQLKASFPVESLGQIWTSVVQTLGSYQGHDEPRTKQFQGNDVVTVKCRMERGAVDLQIVYDKNGKIGGIWTLPPEGANPKRSAQELEKLKRTAQDCLDKLINRDFENVGSNFNHQARLSLPPARLTELWATIMQQLGALKSQEAPELKSAYGYDVVTIKCKMEKGVMAIDLTFDDDGKIGALWLRPTL